jgi:D-arabinose 1-dehydrogenase-like Zn-dependent alcohol dehydrogenase
LVKLSHTGVCHTDLHAKQGDWPIKPNNPLIGGHEGVGEIVAIGENTANSPVKVGDRVGIKWLANSCLDCEFCRKGSEQSESKLATGMSCANFIFRLSECEIQRLHRGWDVLAICRECLMVQTWLL